MYLFKGFLFFVFLITFSRGVGQSISKYRIGIDIEAGGVLSSDERTPFWLRTNQYGAIPFHAPSALMQGKLWRDYAPVDSITKKSKVFDWGVVINPVASFEKVNKLGVIFPEAHFKVKYRFLELYGGRRREVAGLGDTTLTSGFYAVSGNALPIPKIQLATVGYVPFAFRKFLSINAAFSHGWMNNPPYISGARLHQKHLYFRLGRPASKSKFYIGINHQATWAGHSDYLKAKPDVAEDGRLPDSWKLYKYLVLGYTPKDWYKKAGFTSFDSYRIGNHLGSYDAAFETNIGGGRLLVYHQHPFEDVSSVAFQNFPDGLYGVNLVLNSSKILRGFKLTRLTLEMLTTKDQSGSQFYITGSVFQGADNYFNHSQYIGGWSYKDAVIGTPFIAPARDLELSKYGAPRFFPNNRVNMFYAGAQGKYGESLLLTFRASFSVNYGTPGAVIDPPLNQFSSLLAAQFQLKRFSNVSLLARLSADKGALIRNSYGGYLGVRRTW
jgi:hypothetical protein